MTLFEDTTHFDGEVAIYEDNQVNTVWLMPASRALHPAPSPGRPNPSGPSPLLLPPAIVTVCGFTLDAWVPLSIAPAEQPKFYEVMDVRPSNSWSMNLPGLFALDHFTRISERKGHIVGICV